MRWRPLTWLLVSLLAGCFWWLGNERATRKGASGPASDRVERTVASPPPQPGEVLSHAGSAQGLPSFSKAPGTTLRHKYRLTNTSRSAGQLARSDKAILLENALLDTAQPLALTIPAQLRTEGDPGSYIVQSSKPLDDAFRAGLKAAGARLVSYIPNNAYLVRASQAAADALAADSQTTVLAYQPYYKLKSSLLALAVEQRPLPDNSVLNLLLFADAEESTRSSLQQMGLEILGEESSPFGPVLRVGQASSLSAPAEIVPALARLPGVQEIELVRRRVPANDLSRVRAGVSTDTQAPRNYLNLTGSNIFVNVNDTGIDTNHPDLLGRVLIDGPFSGIDSNGHGTHVAGIIAGSGLESTTLSNAQGSILPAVLGQFRGKAPGAQLFSLLADPQSGPFISDRYLQETAARTNAQLAGGPFISNNSWNYAGDNEYDLAAASYDAAARDALPLTPGPQPGLYVFAAGNANEALNIWDDGANDEGSGGVPDSILSPATAKNVVTVGAIEQPRNITNQVWQCLAVVSTNGMTNVICATNQEWLPSTDSSNQVAGFSSRGNVGIGIEGDFGRFKPDVVAAGSFVVSARSTEWNQDAYYSPPASMSNHHGNFLLVLSNLNDSLGPYYRYESGASMAAAEVSGALALMQEFFEQRLRLTNSPALMKALLINGARSMSAAYGLRVGGATNSQGWGLINLPNSLGTLTNLNAAAQTGSMFVFDQDPAHALATGQGLTRLVSVNGPAAQNQPLRVTLVWTDPPGNPVAGLKLVNSLELVVTNLETGAVFFGNDIPAFSDFNQPWDTNGAPNMDVVNNVQNVYLQPPLASNYSITIAGNRVNVNAVSASSNGVVQDFALVISAGEGQVPNALVLTNAPLAPLLTAPLVTAVANSFGLSSPNDVGGLLSGQRVGASAPLLSTNTIPLTAGATNAAITIGQTNQWHFYAISNSGGVDFTNAVFITFLASNLALPRLGVFEETNSAWAARAEADIDLYVSTNSTLTNLNPAAIANALQSLGRGGSEAIVLSNAVAGTLYYAGVKSEDQEAAQYSFLADFSNVPFGQSDALGNQLLRGIPQVAWVPDASIDAAQRSVPGELTTLCVPIEATQVRRVIVTNNIGHQLLSDLAGTLIHGQNSVVLNNHLPNRGGTNSYIYDDSSQGDVPGARHTDGPGSLNSFAGQSSAGPPWVLTELDTVAGNVGFDSNLTIFLEQQQPLASGVTVSIGPGGFADEFVVVPAAATNLTVYGNILSGSGPLSMQVCCQDGGGCQAAMIAGAGTNSVAMDKSSNPPLNPGTCVVALANQSAAPVTVFVSASLLLDPNPPAPARFTSTGPALIPDDAVTNSIITVTNAGHVVAAEVGVRIDHPRVSDLVLTLVSPGGARVLLCENRGGFTTNGMGINLPATNTASIQVSGGYQPTTNTIDTGHASGTINIGYQFYSDPDTMYVYYGGLDPTNLLWTSGLVSFAGTTNLSYSGDSSIITIIMNQFGYSDTNTLWEYTVTSTAAQYQYVTFNEDTNLASIPIKFAVPPFANSPAQPGLFYLPEESLDKLAGELVYGPWQLEIVDDRVGPGGAGTVPKLVSWELSLLLDTPPPAPIALAHGVSVTSTAGPGTIQYFTVAVPDWARDVTNWLVSASGPVNLLFNQSLPPAGTNAGDFTLLSNSIGSAFTLRTNTTPPLVAGVTFYLGVQNTNAVSVTFSLQVDFDVTALNDGARLACAPLAPGQKRYFSFGAATNASALSFQVLAPSVTIYLAASKGPAFPNLEGYDYGSFNPGVNGQQIIVFNNSQPVPLSPGQWYLEVFNNDVTNGIYTMLAVQYTNAFPNIITLQDGVAYANANSGGADYYQYVVSTNALRAQFEIDQPGAEVVLVARKGLPLPTLASYDLISANPGSNGQLLVLYNYSSPVALTPGPWFLSAVNVSGGPAAYAIEATEWPSYGTNIVITNEANVSNSLCITWTSLPGIEYLVEGKLGLSTTNWTIASPIITATDYATTYCIPLPSPFEFFRIVEQQGAPIPALQPINITGVATTPQGMLLLWTAPTNSQFEVQWSASLDPTAWSTFNGAVLSTNGSFSFLDDGSQTGGLGASRFYRLLQFPY